MRREQLKDKFKSIRAKVDSDVAELMVKFIRTLFMSTNPMDWITDDNCYDVNVTLKVPKTIIQIIEDVTKDNPDQRKLIYNSLFKAACYRCSEELVVERVKTDIINKIREGKIEGKKLSDLDLMEPLGSA